MNMEAAKVLFNILSLFVIIVAIVIYYQQDAFNLMVQILVVAAVILAGLSGYFRIKSRR